MYLTFRKTKILKILQSIFGKAPSAEKYPESLVNAAIECQSALKIDPPSASKIDPPQVVVFTY